EPIAVPAAEAMTTSVTGILPGLGAPKRRSTHSQMLPAGLSPRLRRGARLRSMATTVRTLQNFIDSEPVDPADGQTEPIINPATGEVIANAPLSTEADVERAVKAARAAFPGWSTATPGERASALLKLADAIEEHADELTE